MILLTGGSGLLGTQIRKLMPEVFAPSHEQMDIMAGRYGHEEIPSLIIHAAAYTNVNKAEEERDLSYQTNVMGTRNLASMNVPMLFISTDSVFDGVKGQYSEKDLPNPKNFYSLTKLLGEHEVEKGVIVRCCPKTYPWAHDVACTDRWFSAEYVHQTAEKIVKIADWMLQDKWLPRVIHIGSKRRTHFEMAQETRPDVRGIEIHEYAVPRGRDLSLDTSLWESIQ